MNQNVFEPYELFGYLASGFAVMVGMQYTFGFPVVVGSTLTPLELLMVLAGAYLAGQLASSPAKAVLEDLLVGKILGRPSDLLLREGQGGFLGFVFRDYYKPLPKEIGQRLNTRLERERFTGDGEALFLFVRYRPEILADSSLMARLAMFLKQYGFARNLGFVTLLISIAWTLKLILGGSTEPRLLPYTICAAIVTILLVYRYLKFFRQYSFELFNTYANGEIHADSAAPNH